MKKYIPLLFIYVLGIGTGFIFFSEGTALYSGEPERLRTGVSHTVSSTHAQYKNTTLGLSLEYPSELSVHEYPEEGGGYTIVFQQPGEEKGFQIFATPYGDESISLSRITEDVPSGVVREPTEVVVGKNNTRALIFWSEAPVIGESREVWFVHNGYLYEITTYAELDSWLATILATLSVE